MPKLKKTLKIFVLVFIATILISMGLRKNAKAFNLESTNYTIQHGNLNFTAGEKFSDNYTLKDTAGELGPGESDSLNYLVKAGFQYVASIIPFTFTLSNNSVDFGTLTAQSPETLTTNATITSGAAYGYQVTAQENTQLQNTAYAGVYIVDTVGDNADITHTIQGDWALNTTYGFGYTLSDVTGSDATFTTGYRAFADASNTESPVAIMSKNGVTAESEVQVSYKVNISSTQQARAYQNTITYIATGTF